MRRRIGEKKKMPFRLAAAFMLAAGAAALMLAASGAQAQSYRCVGKDGKRYYGSVVPQECYGLPVEQLNAQGMIVRRIDPAGGEKERLAKEAAETKKREEDQATREAARRNRALLATYTSVKDIDDARSRALAENGKAMREVESRIDDIRKRQAGFEKELEYYKGKNDAPARLHDDVKSAEAELKAQQELLEAKKREVDSINARYDLDRKRFAELNRSR
jgi:DNA repair exonuclease SbcCD ATPase subunit